MLDDRPVGRVAGNPHMDRDPARYRPFDLLAKRPLRVPEPVGQDIPQAERQRIEVSGMQNVELGAQRRSEHGCAADDLTRARVQIGGHQD